jgi:hypothetical protein
MRIADKIAGLDVFLDLKLRLFSDIFPYDFPDLSECQYLRAAHVYLLTIHQIKRTNHRFGGVRYVCGG